MTLLDDFRAECRGYYMAARRDSNAVSARVRVYRELLNRHGKDPVVRHWNTIGAVLDRIELEYARGDARKILKGNRSRC